MMHMMGIFSNVLCKSKWTQKKTNIRLNFRLAPHSIIEGLSIIGSIQCHLDARCFHLSTMSSHLKTWHFFVRKEMAMVHWAPPSILGVFLFLLLVCILLTQENSQLSCFLMCGIFHFKELNKITKKKSFQVTIFKH